MIVLKPEKKALQYVIRHLRGLVVACAWLACPVVIAASVKLGWNPNPESDIAGYELQYGTTSNNLSRFLDVGNTTTATIEDLQPATTYYFAVRAYNTAGLYSDFSSQISYNTATPSGLLIADSSGNLVPTSGAMIDLGVVRLGALGDGRTFTLTNQGSTTLTGLRLVSLDGASQHFTVSGIPVQSQVTSDGTFVESLAPGNSLTFTVAFKPGGGGSASALFSLFSDASTASVYEIRFTGTGAIGLDGWLAEKGLSDGPTGNPDRDGLNNLMEYAFATDPLSGSTGAVAVGNGMVASRGTPSVRISTEPENQLLGLFGRRRDHAMFGLRYQPQFSADLITWQDATDPPEVLAVDGEVEIVAITAPADIGGQPPRFFRVGVSQGGQLSFEEWLVAQNASGGGSGNPDGDALSNLMEFAFGTQPLLAQAAGAAEIGGLVASRGAPNARVTGVPGEPGFEFNGIFCRRKDRVATGIGYRPQFSADLVSWHDATIPPAVLADDGEIEVVAIKAPASIGGQSPRFFRVGVGRTAVP